MSQSSLTIRIDDELKAEFLEVCDSMGVPATTALTIFLKRVVRDRRIPFDVTAEPKPTILKEPGSPDISHNPTTTKTGADSEPAQSLKEDSPT